MPATLPVMSAALGSAEKALAHEVGEITALVRRAKVASAALAEAEQIEASCAEASRLLAQFADERQGKVVTAIEGICSAGLTSVFAEEIKLKLTTVTRARRIEIDITVVDEAGLETPVLEARGGGLAAVTAFLLRVTVLLLTKNARRLLVVDEPFAHLSVDYAPRCAEFIAELAVKTNMQIVMVTHDEAFTEAADRVNRVVKSGNEAKVVVEK